MKSFLIWGFGKTGKAILEFIINQQKYTSIYIADKKKIELPTDIIQNIHYVTEQEAQSLINEEKITHFLLSPGLKINSIYHNHPKHLSEIDLFSSIISDKNFDSTFAITGSLGKTTITCFIHQALSLLNKKKKYFLGGNIGNPLININNELLDSTGYVIELSNGQLRFAKKNPWKLAIITNLYPNHLDMHPNFKDYIQSKINIYRYNNSNITVIISYQAYQYLKKEYLLLPKNPIIMGENVIDLNISCTYIENNNIIFWNKETKKKIILLESFKLPSITYIENWFFILTTLYIDNQLIFESNIKEIIKNFIPVEHRLEHVGNYANRIWYNDSKSTVMEATIQATKELKNLFQNKNIAVIIGGLSKGVNRENLFQELLTYTKKVFLYGKSSDSQSDLITLKNIYQNHYSLPITIYENLTDVLMKAIDQTTTDDIILFSPGGASFDFYSNFEHRGIEFKKLVKMFTAYQ
jgi:UDP-N-acetylmuramoylalanine--D-glutamate ligase